MNAYLNDLISGLGVWAAIVVGVALFL